MWFTKDGVRRVGSFHDNRTFLLLNHSTLMARFGTSKIDLSPPVCFGIWASVVAYTLSLYLVEASRMATFLGKS